MYYQWKNRRIVTEIAVWGAAEGIAPQFVHTLADAASERVESGELQELDISGAVGIPRNKSAISVDEPDRKFTIFFCHPEGETGYFRDHPVDYKIAAPEAPVEDNRAFETVLKGASGILFLADGRPDIDEPALDALSESFHDDLDNSELAFHAVLSPEGTEQPDADSFEQSHQLPTNAEVVEAPTWSADGVWDVFIGLANELRSNLEEASRRDELPI